MKKLLLLILITNLSFLPALAKTDKTSADYLKNKKHFAIMNPFVENVAQKVIKKALKKEIGDGSYKVKFEGYTLSSMKKGIFKNLEVTGKDLTIDEIPVPYLKIKTETDYNWVDFNEDPIKIKSDITALYELELTEKSINAALKQKDYQKTLDNLNKRAYPLFTMHEVRVKIRHNKIHIIMSYSLPLASNNKKKTFMVSSNFQVDNGKIKASNIGIDNAYGNLPIDKVANLVNLINPLSFALAQINDSDCRGQVENIKIDDNIIQINGRIFIVKNKGE